MADRDDKFTLTITRYDEPNRLWPVTKLLGKWRQLPIGYRKLGSGRIAIDTIKGYSLVIECWWLRFK